MTPMRPTDIEWSEPILPETADPEWEAEVKRRVGAVPTFMRRMAPSRWLRQAALDWNSYRYRHLTKRQTDIAFLVISQENSCRYCYGAARAFMRILGYGETLISHIERQAQLAELDDRERAFVTFCRNLARSKPRPGRKAREELVALGYAPEAVTEMAFLVAANCFGNRITTLMACPPELGLERMSTHWLFRPLWPLLRRMLSRPATPAPEVGLPPGSGDAVAETLRGLPAAGLVHNSMTEAFASPVIPRETKALMLAVIARSLECQYCEAQMRDILAEAGLPGAAVDASLNSLTAPNGDPNTQALIQWARGTVHYQPQEIQRQTRALLAQVGPAQTLEAIGFAAMANATVRLATLLV